MIDETQAERVDRAIRRLLTLSVVGAGGLGALVVYAVARAIV